MTAPMKLSAKLPETRTVDALAAAMAERPLKSRLLVVEVAAPRLQLDVDPDGEEVRTPVASITSLAWITDPDDCTDVRMAARRAWDSHTPQPELPAPGSFNDALHQAMASGAYDGLAGVTLRTSDGRETVGATHGEDGRA